MNACAPFEHIRSIGNMTQHIALELCGVCGRVVNWDLNTFGKCITSYSDEARTKLRKPQGFYGVSRNQLNKLTYEEINKTHYR